MISIASAIYAIKALVAASIFFVWVVRYQNIIEEFKVYELPEWLRDLVGIFKLSFALMLYSNDPIVILLGASGITVLMVAAVFTHLRIKNSFYKMLPSISLTIFSSVIFLYTFQSQ